VDVFLATGVDRTESRRTVCAGRDCRGSPASFVPGACKTEFNLNHYIQEVSTTCHSGIIQAISLHSGEESMYRILESNECAETPAQFINIKQDPIEVHKLRRKLENNSIARDNDTYCRSMTQAQLRLDRSSKCELGV
jgi:hypothetical protein